MNFAEAAGSALRTVILYKKPLTYGGRRLDKGRKIAPKASSRQQKGEDVKDKWTRLDKNSGDYPYSVGYD